MTADAKQRLKELWPAFEHYIKNECHSWTMPVNQEQMGYWIDFCTWYSEQQKVLASNAPDMPGPLKDALIGGPDD